MTATQKAWFALIYFIVMLLISYLCRRLLWEAVCKAGGTTLEGIKEKRAELLNTTSSARSLQTSFNIWMKKNAPDPKKYQRLSTIYNFCLIPNVICVFLAFAQFNVRAFGTALKIGMIVVPVCAIISLFIGIWYKKHDNK